MFIEEYVNDWGELTYLPTTLSKIILAVVLVILLSLAVVISIKKHKIKMTAKLTAKQLVFCAMAIAMGTILSNIKLFRFPTSGSVTLFSMLVICIPGFLFGLVPGILTGIAYGVLQLIINPYVLYPAQLVVDYILAFGALGLSGIFTNAKNGLLKGYITGVIGRYVFSVISGWIFFGSYAWDGWKALPYSLVYNAIYIFAEMALTVILLLLPPVKNGFGYIKKISLE